MAHYPQTLETISRNDPTLQRIKRVPVGIVVKYHGRVGSMRQGRTEFPAFVLKQHPDDGSLDLLVFFEAEDMIWEQRVQPWSDTNPGHSWAPVEEVDEDDTSQSRLDEMNNIIQMLKRAMYGNYNIPDKSMIEYLDAFDARLSKLEAKLRK